MRTVLVVGGSGVIGSATVAAFAERPDTRVVALSRRRPDVAPDTPFTHVAADLDDAADCVRAVREIGDITHMVYAAAMETPGLSAGWTDPAVMQRNLDMLRNIVEPVAERGALSHLSLMQGTKAYGAHLHSICLPARETQPRDPHPNFYWLHEDYVRAKAADDGWAWTVFRPQVLLGGATGVAMNPVPVIGVLAALAHEEGTPFAFPGHALTIAQAVDARLVAQACAWAAECPATHGETYNIDNGDVWVLKHMWPALGAMLGLADAPDAPVDVAALLDDKAATWDRIVARHGLRPQTLATLLGESHHYLELLLFRREPPPPPALVSSIKLRQAGFAGCYDTLESFRYWLDVLVRNRTLPPMGGFGRSAR